MLRKLPFLLTLMLLTFSVGWVFAQNTPTAPTSNVTIFLVICDNRAVINLSGTMQAGYDVYFQIFNAPAGTGTAITGLRQAAVNGDFTFSESVSYNSGSTVAAGSTGSARVTIGRETNAESTIYETTVNDFQDGCAEPQFGAGTSQNTDAAPEIDYGPRILSPFGGFLNPDYNPREQPIVVIGARDTTPPRQQTPGLVFAECNKYPLANPGLIYDTDNVVVFWSWFARTPELVQDHINNAIYEVGVFDSEPFIQPVEVSEIQQRGRNYWVFYTIRVGNVRPGNYPIEFKLSWRNPISDGYNDFGPGTANERESSTCTFRVRPNPEGRVVRYNFP
ncbi:MAG: hypothetical protein MUF87_11920 [Anaerolineae bacterium]|jgi:hypothetical protein|nr:hypothetical protein [Anaerolineae bacterium]